MSDIPYLLISDTEIQFKGASGDGFTIAAGSPITVTCVCGREQPFSMARFCDQCGCPIDLTFPSEREK